MSDQGASANDSSEQPSPAGGDIKSDNRKSAPVNSRILVGGTGAVLGGASTLAAAISLKDLFQDYPFLALAVFSVLVSFLIFVVALMRYTSTSQLWPAATFATALLGIGVASGFVAMRNGPVKVQLFITAMPAINAADPIKLVGRKEYVVGWNGQTSIVEGGRLTLDLNGVKNYYEQELKGVKAASTEEQLQTIKNCLRAGPGSPSASTLSQAS